MITLSGLYIYPIKSTAPVALNRAQAQPEGLAHDRRYVVTDRRGRFFTARRFPRMVLIQSTLRANGLLVNAPDQPPLALEPAGFPTDYDDITVWRDTVRGQRCGDAADKWFSRFLGVDARLYYMGPLSHRPARGGGVVSFADAAPLLALSQASVDDLNTRLATPVGVRNFRPNLLFTGSDAYAEDEWPDFTIGEVSCRALWRCERCILTTVNPDTGVLDPQRQPLETLRAYRSGDGEAVYFGLNVAIARTGYLEVGQPVEFEN